MIDVSNYSMFFKDIVRDKKAWTITSSDIHFKQEVKDHLNIMRFCTENYKKFNAEFKTFTLSILYLIYVEGEKVKIL